MPQPFKPIMLMVKTVVGAEDVHVSPTAPDVTQAMETAYSAAGFPLQTDSWITNYTLPVGNSHRTGWILWVY